MKLFKSLGIEPKEISIYDDLPLFDTDLGLEPEEISVLEDI